MDENRVTALSMGISARLAAAKLELSQRMKALGLTPAAGWRVTEELRHTLNGTEWIFRPVHLREPSPDLHARVAIDHEGRLME